MKKEDTFLLLFQIENAIAELDLKGTDKNITQAMSIVRVAGESLRNGVIAEKSVLLQTMHKKMTA